MESLKKTSNMSGSARTRVIPEQVGCERRALPSLIAVHTVGKSRNLKDQPPWRWDTKLASVCLYRRSPPWFSGVSGAAHSSMLLQNLWFILGFPHLLHMYQCVTTFGVRSYVLMRFLPRVTWPEHVACTCNQGTQLDATWRITFFTTWLAPSFSIIFVKKTA